MTPPVEMAELRSKCESVYQKQIPTSWGDRLAGIITHFEPGGKVIALTFDACGSGKKDGGYDAELIAYLKREKVPATLFISGLWADKHPEIVKALAADPLFNIENHGLHHRPCSVNGRSAYHIRGTKDPGEVVDEVELNTRKLVELTGVKPHLFRSATAMYDNVALKIVEELGYTAVGYNLLGDAGATYTASQVKAALLRANPGDIVLFHMNHPEGETCEGIKEAIPALKKQGFSFEVLSKLSLSGS